MNTGILMSAIMAVIACLFLRSGSPKGSIGRKRADWLTIAALVVLPGQMIAEHITLSMSDYRPAKLDLYAYSIDQAFGQPSFFFGKLLLRFPWLNVAATIAYDLAAISMVALIALYIWSKPQEIRTVAVTFMFCWFILPAFYWLVPICGPAFAFAKFPELPGIILPHAIPINAPPNGMPSGHFANALLIWWFLRRWGWGRITGLIFVALTFLATLGSGQHYLIDLIAAVPYAAGVAWLGRIGRRSRRASQPVELPGPPMDRAMAA